MKFSKDSKNHINFTYSNENLNLQDFLNTIELSGRMFRRLYREKKILVNGKFQRKGIILKKGDIVSLVMDDEIENIEPKKMNLDIIYEDDEIGRASCRERV